MLSHTPDTGISESDYLAIREELRAALKGLGFDEGELDRLETDSCLSYDEEFMNLKKRVDKLEQKVNQANVPTQERQRTFICGGTFSCLINSCFKKRPSDLPCVILGKNRI